MKTYNPDPNFGLPHTFVAAAVSADQAADNLWRNRSWGYAIPFGLAGLSLFCLSAAFTGGSTSAIFASAATGYFAADEALHINHKRA